MTEPLTTGKPNTARSSQPVRFSDDRKAAIVTAAYVLDLARR